MKYFGSMFGFMLTIIGLVICGSYLIHLLVDSLMGESNTFTQFTMANNFGDNYEIANMSDPINDYNFKGKINIITWPEIQQKDLYDIYNVP
jgi:hypothetical protein